MVMVVWMQDRWGASRGLEAVVYPWARSVLSTDVSIFSEFSTSTLSQLFSWYSRRVQTYSGVDIDTELDSARQRTPQNLPNRMSRRPSR